MPQDKAEALAEHFAQTFKPNNTPVHPDHQAIIDSNGAPNYDVPQRLKFISPTEVKNLIKKLPKRKAPGHDLISNQILKNLPTTTIAYINNIYNSSFRLGYFPRTWTISNIIPIPKPSTNHSLAVNYRPISLLPTLSKLFEKIILKRLNNHLTKSEAIPNHQFGFRKRISTAHQLLRITEYIHTAFQEKKHSIVTLLDVSQAFDRVWHPGLIYKLKTIATPKYLLNIITQFISDRVTIDNHSSNPRPIEAGLPQGTPLSPTLFNIYTADIPTTRYTQLAQFADDTAIFTSSCTLTYSSTKIQQHLNKIDERAIKWKIELNPNK